ncbi:DNA replication protein DnaD, partial [Pseudoflavonifractor phocaeensis]|nr:DNA replication protein DnaD [Pseudoflavonifractor phocaeensis]
MPELLLPGNIISMDARAADRLMAAGAGDAALLYLWLLRHGGQLSPDAARKGLKWDGQRLEEASARLVALGLSDGKTQAEAAPV